MSIPGDRVHRHDDLRRRRGINVGRTVGKRYDYGEHEGLSFGIYDLVDCDGQHPDSQSQGVLPLEGEFISDTVLSQSRCPR